MRYRTILLLFLVLGPASAMAEDGQAARLNQEGNLLYQEGKLEEALKRYAEALALDPASSALQYNLGNALCRAGRFEEALDAYSQAAAGQEMSSDLGQAARFNEGTASLQAEDFENAVRSLREAVIANPDDEGGRHNLELALARLQEQQQQEQEQEQEQEGKEDQQESGEEGQQDSDQSQEGEEEQEQNQEGDRQNEQEPDPQGDSPPQPQGNQQDEPPESPEGSEPTPAEERQDLSEEEARRLLAALDRDEREELKESLEKPKKRKSGGGRDW